ncbi:helix-turn-helix domain-containing protein [Mucilaginibacter flavidus]|uniref:helix-turn-helix domain-containing protein n=1 Tax=Mucilaginibacter flavidus TaxID=2949309 RepID=UPI0020932F05|nr:helix-turn-helix domain-containing protein [Mucilaginibacter flavidus]MCO5949887.1 helix-turn-helix domain-containing protein [Mucilaginibacter flavidus]
MIYRFFQPQPALKAYVKEYLLLHFRFDGLSIDPTRLYIPQPEQCLTFNPKGHLTAINQHTGKVQRRNYSYISGQQTSCLELHFDQDYLMLKVIFQPGALYRLLGIPLSEFADLYVDAETVLHREMRQVNEMLANAVGYQDIIGIVEGYLLQKTSGIKVNTQPIDKISDILNRQPTQFSLNWFAEQACLSPRQFERKFLERMGISPKLYCRIARFYKAFQLKDKTSDVNWLAVALDCGYADFQHLSKDFKQFANTTPTALLKAESVAVERQLKLR